jgi:hypothetical protein
MKFRSRQGKHDGSLIMRTRWWRVDESLQLGARGVVVSGLDRGSCSVKSNRYDALVMGRSPMVPFARHRRHYTKRQQRHAATHDGQA